MLNRRTRELCKSINVILCLSMLLGSITGCAPRVPSRPSAVAAGPGADLPPRPPGMASLATRPGQSVSQAVMRAASLSLEPGWHLVSIPEEPADTAPEAVLSSIAGDYERVYAYDGCDAADPWKLYDPADPAASNLAAIDHKIGFWIAMTNTANLNVAGTEPISTQVRLCEGWNLVGYPLATSLPVTHALASIAGQYTRVFAHDAADQADPWAVFDPAVPPWVNDLQLMKAGQGYWILATENVTLTLERVPPIASPAEGAELTGQVDVVGTAVDENMAYYVLEYGPFVPGQPIQFSPIVSSTTPVVEGVLGTLDTTLLPNGLGRLRLTTFDGQGNAIGAWERDVQLVGANKPGIFTLSFVDLQVPVSGIPITIKRSYDSRERNREMDFGFGWDLEVVAAGSYVNNRKPGDGWAVTPGTGGLGGLYCSASETKSHFTEIRFSDTEFYRFRFKIDQFLHSIGRCEGWVSFEQVGGVPGAELEILGNNEIVWESGPDQLLDLSTFEVYEPQDVRLIVPDGRQFDLNLTQGLTRIADPNGNSLQISSTGVSHSSGLGVTFVRDGQGRITQITDPLGNSLTYGYDDASGDLISVTDRLSNTTTFTYDPNHVHLLKDIVDPLDNTPLRNEYNEQGRLVAVVDADGHRTVISTTVTANTTNLTDRLGNETNVEYNEAGLITEATAGDFSVQRTYDDRGNKASETDALGHTRFFAYDANDNLISETDALSNTIAYTYTHGQIAGVTYPGDDGAITNRFVYDDAGNLLEIRNANDEVVETHTYYPDGNRKTTTNSLGGTTTFTYTTFGYVSREQGPNGLDKSSTYDDSGNKLTETVKRTISGTVVYETTRYTYDANDNQLSITDPLSNVTTFTYDYRGRVTSKTDARGFTTTFEYDKRGDLVRKDYPDGTFEIFGYDEENRKTAHTNRAGQTTFFDYDRQGNLVRTTLPDGATVENKFDVRNALIGTVNERGYTTTFGLNPNGQRIRVTNPFSDVFRVARNPGGAVISTTNPLGHATQFGYDESLFGPSQITGIVSPDGAAREWAYDPQGHLLSYADEADQLTSFEYDQAGNLITVTDALGFTTLYSYDELGNRVGQTDANGHTTTFEYDANGHVVRRTLPEGMFETFAYDAVGNMIAHTNFDGQLTTFEYDALSHLVRKNLPDQTITFAYTPLGQVEAITDTQGVTRITYDEQRGWLTGVENPDGTTISYTYDAAGNRTSVETVAGTTRYTYDAANRLETVTDPQGGVLTYTYDLAGNRASITYPNGTETHYEYDVRDRLTAIEHTGPGWTPLLARYDYRLGPVGNRTRLTEASGRVVTYTFDALYRLVEEVDAFAGTVVTTTYSYDRVGNRLTMTRDGVETTYSYDANDRMLTAGTANLSYDASGNLIRREEGGSVTQYEYDADSRLIRQIADGITTIFTYDAFGNRVQRNTGGEITQFVVDRIDNSGLAQVLVEQDGAGSVTVSYVYGDDLISMRRGADTHYYHYDGTGSTRLLTDGAGQVSDVYTYDAFGNVISATGSTLNAYLFAGEQLDPNLGFYYLRARYMSPEWGRFVATDSFQGSLFDPPSLHKYTYAGNDPVSKVDPTGLFTMATVGTSLSVSAALNSLSMSVVLGGTFAILVLNYMKPGLEMRARALDTIAATDDDETIAWALNLYEQGQAIISLSAQAIETTYRLQTFALNFLGLAKSVTSLFASVDVSRLAQAQQVIAIANEFQIAHLQLEMTLDHLEKEPPTNTESYTRNIRRWFSAAVALLSAIRGIPSTKPWPSRPGQAYWPDVHASEAVKEMNKYRY